MSEAGGLTDLDEIVDIDRHVDLKRTLERAVEENRVEIFLQPIIHSSTDRMVGAEVLARIRGEDGQPISPNLFIPIAEQNGQINKLGRQVFEKALICTVDLKLKLICLYNGGVQERDIWKFLRVD